MSNKTIYGTDQNDFIDASYENGTIWGDHVDAGAGDDVVILGPGVKFYTGPGNDTVQLSEFLYGSYSGLIL